MKRHGLSITMTALAASLTLLGGCMDVPGLKGLLASPAPGATPGATPSASGSAQPSATPTPTPTASPATSAAGYGIITNVLSTASIPQPVVLGRGENQDFYAATLPGTGYPVMVNDTTWSATGGSLAYPSGAPYRAWLRYTAPVAAGSYSLTATKGTETANVTISVPWSVNIKGVATSWVGTDNAGNVFAMGSTRGGMGSDTHIGSLDADNAYIVKYSADGMVQWSKLLNSQFTSNSQPGLLTVKGGVVNADGSVVLALKGDASSSFNGVASNYWLAKYDNAGNHVWTKAMVLGSGGSDMLPNGFTRDAAGALYVVGFDVNQGGAVAKFDANGDFLWSRYLGFTWSTYDGAIAVDAAGNAYAVGTVTGQGRDARLVKVNADGTLGWTYNLATSAWDEGLAVTVDSTGAVYWSGYTKGSLPGGTSAGMEDGWIAKVDSAGTQAWLKQIGSSSDDRFNGLACDATDALYAVGTQGAGFTAGAVAGSDFALLKIDATGTEVYRRQLGTANQDQGRAVAVRAGWVYATGFGSSGFEHYAATFPGTTVLMKFGTDGTKQ